jgi:hypothetical protein
MKLYLFLDIINVEEDAVGEVNMQVDLFTNPRTGEQKISVKGIEFNFLIANPILIFFCTYLSFIK